MGSGVHPRDYPLGDLQRLTNLHLVPAPIRFHILEFQKLSSLTIKQFNN